MTPKTGPGAHPTHCWKAQGQGARPLTSFSPWDLFKAGEEKLSAAICTSALGLHVKGELHRKSTASYRVPALTGHAIAFLYRLEGTCARYGPLIAPYCPGHSTTGWMGEYTGQWGAVAPGTPYPTSRLNDSLEESESSEPHSRSVENQLGLCNADHSLKTHLRTPATLHTAH